MHKSVSCHGSSVDYFGGSGAADRGCAAGGIFGNWYSRDVDRDHERAFDAVACGDYGVDVLWKNWKLILRPVIYTEEKDSASATAS